MNSIKNCLDLLQDDYDAYSELKFSNEFPDEKNSIVELIPVEEGELEEEGGARQATSTPASSNPINIDHENITSDAEENDFRLKCEFVSIISDGERIILFLHVYG